jgi:hypothetical protein
MDLLVSAIEKTFAAILELLASVKQLSSFPQPTPSPDGDEEPLACSLNIAVSDGINTVVTRFRSGELHHSQPPSLYYSYGSAYCRERGCFLHSFDLDVDQGHDEGLPPEETGGIGTGGVKLPLSSPSSSSCGSRPCTDVQGLIITSSPLNMDPHGRDVDIARDDLEAWETQRLHADTLAGDKHWRLVPPNTMILTSVNPLNPEYVVNINMKPIVIESTTPTTTPCKSGKSAPSFNHSIGDAASARGGSSSSSKIPLPNRHPHPVSSPPNLNDDKDFVNLVLQLPSRLRKVPSIHDWLARESKDGSSIESTPPKSNPGSMSTSARSSAQPSPSSTTNTTTTGAASSSSSSQCNKHGAGTVCGMRVAHSEVVSARRTRSRSGGGFFGPGVGAGDDQLDENGDLTDSPTTNGSGEEGGMSVATSIVDRVRRKAKISWLAKGESDDGGRDSRNVEAEEWECRGCRMAVLAVERSEILLTVAVVGLVALSSIHLAMYFSFKR